ncbi:MAG: oligosaccharide flippase family protein [Candidatus Nanoarchaeia archaeon]|jgi:O-antigen/teichoic acid export membrane protein
MEEVIKKVGKNATWHLIGKSVSTVLSMVLIFFLARLLGPTDYGTFALVITILTLSHQLTTLGLEHGLPYFMQKYKEQMASLVKKIISVRLIIGVITAIAVFVAADYIGVFYNNTELGSYLRLTALFIPFFILMNISYYIFQGFNNLKHYMNVDLLFSATKFASLLLIIIGLGITGAVIGYGISYLITVLFAYAVIYNKLSKGSEFTERKELLKYSTTMFFTSIFMTLSNYLMNLYLGFNSSELSFFDLSNKAGLFILLISGAISSALLPSIINKKKEEIKELTGRFMKYVFIYALPIATIFFSASNFIITLLLGSEYLGMISVFRVMAIGLSAMAFYQIYESITYGTGKPRIVLWISIIKVIITIALSSYLINAFNASIIFTGLMVSALIIMSVTQRKYVKHNWVSYVKSLISALPLIIVVNVYTGPIMKILLFSLAAVFYALMVYYKVLDKQDRGFITKLIKKIISLLYAKKTKCI